MEKVSLVIPNYNGKEVLQKNLPSVLEAVVAYTQQKKTTAEIIIVDDASSDDSVAFLQEFVAKLQGKSVTMTFLIHKKNKGFAPTVNYGVRAATGEIVVLINTDVRPEKNFLIPLLAHFSDKKVFAVGCLDKSREEGKEVLRGRGIGQWKRGFLVHSAGRLDKPTTLWASGGSSAFRKSLWEQLGGMLEIYAPFYWEDIDLSYRAWKAGFRVLFEPQSVVIHEHEEGAIRKSRSQIEIQQIAYRNQILFVWINATDLAIWLSHVFWMPYHISKAILRGDSAFLQGLLQAFLLLPKSIQLSSRQKKRNTLSDEEVVRQFTE